MSAGHVRADGTPTVPRLHERIALVAGGAQGLGRAVVDRFVEDGIGGVVVVDVDADSLGRLEKEYGDLVVCLAGDAAEMSVAQDAAAVALRTFGRIDVLVNIVGGGAAGKIWEISEDHWDEVIRRNIRPMFVFTQAVLPPMMARQYGRIVNMSAGARRGSRWLAEYSGAAPYSTAKAGVVGFTRDVALEVAGHGIAVNAVSPGPINTDRVKTYGFATDASLPLGPVALTPMKRFGEPSEVANAVAFLASDEASYITGHTLDVDGGI